MTPAKAITMARPHLCLLGSEELRIQILPCLLCRPTSGHGGIAGRRWRVWCASTTKGAGRVERKGANRMSLLHGVTQTQLAARAAREKAIAEATSKLVLAAEEVG